MINKGDNTGALGRQFLVVYINNPLGVKFSKAVVQCGKVSKNFINPEFPLVVNFTGDETEEFRKANTAYLFVWDEDGRRVTANGSITFKTRDIKTPYIDTPSSNVSTGAPEVNYDFTGFAEFDAVFEVNVTPSKVSHLENDLGFQTQEDVEGLISAHNEAEHVHPYLQNQIDTLVARADVVDIVGTYQELLDYDTKHLTDNDIIKVLEDDTHDNSRSYYRWVTTPEGSSWVYVGSEVVKTTLADLTDTEIINPQVNDTLFFNGEKWINRYSYTAEDIDTKLAEKMDRVAIASPLGLQVISNTPDNISSTLAGRSYLNLKAFNAFHEGMVNAKDGETNLSISANLTSMQMYIPQNSMATGDYTGGAKCDLTGYTSFIRDFTYGDIIMSANFPYWGSSGWARNGDLNKSRSFVLGTLDTEGLFTPKILIGNTREGDNGRGWLRIRECTEKPYFTSYFQYGYGLYASYNFDVNQTYDIVSLQSFSEGRTPDYRGIRLRRTEVSGMEKLAIDWVYSDGSFVEAGVAKTPLTNLALNCVLFQSNAVKSETYEGETWTFLASDCYIANGSINNKVLTLGEVSQTSYLSLLYDKDTLEVIDTGLNAKTATQDALGIVKPDNTTISINTEGILSVPQDKIDTALSNIDNLSTNIETISTEIEGLNTEVEDLSTLTNGFQAQLDRKQDKMQIQIPLEQRVVSSGASPYYVATDDGKYYYLSHETGLNLVQTGYAFGSEFRPRFYGTPHDTQKIYPEMDKRFSLFKPLQEGDIISYATKISNETGTGKSMILGTLNPDASFVPKICVALTSIRITVDAISTSTTFARIINHSTTECEYGWTAYTTTKVESAITNANKGYLQIGQDASGNMTFTCISSDSSATVALPQSLEWYGINSIILTTYKDSNDVMLSKASTALGSVPEDYYLVDIENTFIANGTLDNKLVTLGQVSTEEFLQLNYDNDSLVLNSSNKLSVNFSSNASVTLQGNEFNNANQLVQLTNEGKLPAIDGSNLTNLPIGDTYTKEETGNLLDTKMDKVDTIEPLSISVLTSGGNFDTTADGKYAYMPYSFNPAVLAGQSVSDSYVVKVQYDGRDGASQKLYFSNILNRGIAEAPRLDLEHNMTFLKPLVQGTIVAVNAKISGKSIILGTLESDGSFYPKIAVAYNSNTGAYPLNYMYTSKSSTYSYAIVTNGNTNSTEVSISNITESDGVISEIRYIQLNTDSSTGKAKLDIYGGSNIESATLGISLNLPETIEWYNLNCVLFTGDADTSYSTNYVLGTSIVEGQEPSNEAYYIDIANTFIAQDTIDNKVLILADVSSDKYLQLQYNNTLVVDTSNKLGVNYNDTLILDSDNKLGVDFSKISTGDSYSKEEIDTKDTQLSNAILLKQDRFDVTSPLKISSIESGGSPYYTLTVDSSYYYLPKELNGYNDFTVSWSNSINGTERFEGWFSNSSILDGKLILDLDKQFALQRTLQVNDILSTGFADNGAYEFLLGTLGSDGSFIPKVGVILSSEYFNIRCISTATGAPTIAYLGGTANRFNYPRYNTTNLYKALTGALGQPVTVGVEEGTEKLTFSVTVSDEVHTLVLPETLEWYNLNCTLLLSKGSITGIGSFGIKHSTTEGTPAPQAFQISVENTFIANGTLDNKIVTLGTVTKGDYLQLDYSNSLKLDESNRLTVNPEGLEGVQLVSNLVTEVSENSTDTQYPSALCIFNLIGDINRLLDELNGETESEEAMLNVLNGEVV